MTKDKTILIRNIYYMLSYAFQELKKNNYENIAKEDFDNIQNLFAEILYKGVSAQLKRGLHRQYVGKIETMPLLRGRLDIRGTITEKLKLHNLLNCEYDDLSENNIFNKVLKTTISALVNSLDVTAKRRKQLKQLIHFFSGVEEIDLKSIPWNNFVYHRNNQSYRMLMNVCYFVLKGSLLTTETGKYKIATFLEEHMDRLFEHFVLEYYRKHHKELSANPDKISWNINFDEPTDIELLPDMRSDIVLHKNGRTLIIDTKYYSSTLQKHFDKFTIHSHNLYQIFTYVKNLDIENSGNVRGLLLYAKTDEEKSPCLSASFGKNRIFVRVLDLSKSFNLIKEQLDSFVNFLN